MRMRNNLPHYIFFGHLTLVRQQSSLTEQQATALEYEATADPQPAQLQDSWRVASLYLGLF